MTTPIDPKEAAKALAEELQTKWGRIYSEDEYRAVILKHFQKFTEGMEKRALDQPKRCCLCGNVIQYEVELAQVIPDFHMHAKCWHEKIEDPRHELVKLRTERDQLSAQLEAMDESRQKLQARVETLERERDQLAGQVKELEAALRKQQGVPAKL